MFNLTQNVMRRCAVQPEMGRNKKELEMVERDLLSQILDWLWIGLWTRMVF